MMWLAFSALVVILGAETMAVVFLAEKTRNQRETIQGKDELIADLGRMLGVKNVKPVGSREFDFDAITLPR